MRYVELVPGVRSSVLGFGCAPILGSVDARTSRRALDCAIECGITHFDLARSYGYGDAESFVGRVLQRKRDRLVLASKFGITARWQARLLAPAKPFVRWLKRPKHAAESGVATVRNTVGDRFHVRVPLREKTLRNSLNTSLRALRTDYLDFLFIHEPVESITHIDELLSTAETFKNAGKIRAFGLATSWKHIEAHREYQSEFDVLQINSRPARYENSWLKARSSHTPLVFYSPFREASGGNRRREVLRAIQETFPRAVVLCSMFQARHILENVAAASGSLATDA